MQELGTSYPEPASDGLPVHPYIAFNGGSSLGYLDSEAQKVWQGESVRVDSSTESFMLLTLPPLQLASLVVSAAVDAMLPKIFNPTIEECKCDCVAVSSSPTKVPTMSPSTKQVRCNRSLIMSSPQMQR